jgi:hypothetical protein
MGDKFPQDFTAETSVARTHEFLMDNGAANRKATLANMMLGAGVLDYNNLLYIEDQKSSGTNGGTFNSGAWQTRTLNTKVVDAISGASLSSNQITLPAGTYWVEAHACASKVNSHKCKLRNITDSSDAIIGSTQEIDAAPNITSVSSLFGKITIAAAKAFELQHRCQSSRATDGFGRQSGFGVIEVYAQIKIWKVAA